MAELGQQSREGMRSGVIRQQPNGDRRLVSRSSGYSRPENESLLRIHNYRHQTCIDNTRAMLIAFSLASVNVLPVSKMNRIRPSNAGDDGTWDRKLSVS